MTNPSEQANPTLKTKVNRRLQADVEITFGVRKKTTDDDAISLIDTWLAKELARQIICENPAYLASETKDIGESRTNMQSRTKTLTVGASPARPGESS